MIDPEDVVMENNEPIGFNLDPYEMYSHVWKSIWPNENENLVMYKLDFHSDEHASATFTAAEFEEDVDPRSEDFDPESRIEGSKVVKMISKEIITEHEQAFMIKLMSEMLGNDITMTEDGKERKILFVEGEFDEDGNVIIPDIEGLDDINTE